MSQKVNMETKLAQKLGMWTIPPKSVDEYRVTSVTTLSHEVIFYPDPQYLNYCERIQ